MRSFLLVWIAVTVIGFVSCSDEVISLEGVDSRRGRIPAEIVSLVDSCINCGCHWRFDAASEHQVDIRYSKIYFSPDSNKIFLIVTYQINDYQNNAKPELDFQIWADAIIGYKENSNWKLYVFGKMMPAGYYSWKEVEEGMIGFFEGKNFRRKSPVYALGKDEDGYVYKYKENPEFSPNQKEFWTSRLWQKNVEIEGAYPFEITRTNVSSDWQPSINEALKDCK